MPQYSYNPPRTKTQKTTPDSQKEESSFPIGIFLMALFFDYPLGLIPFLNIVTNFIAGGILWFWQKKYVPHVDPLSSFMTSRIAGFIPGLPANIGVVIFSFIQKKAAAKSPTRAAANA